ncbi:hypothetical protein SRDD_12480 [Serratia sp. DD3]|nr:hypothetical protein SRDD_12480 [Serratia sp. DD3]
MAQTGIKGPTLYAVRVPFCQEGFRVVIGFTGGDPLYTAETFRAVLRGQCLTVVIIPGGHTAGHHMVSRLDIPDTLLTTVTHPRRMTKRQVGAELILRLGVLTYHHILLQAAVHFKTPENAHFRQQTLHKFQVGFTPLGDQLTRRVFP